MKEIWTKERAEYHGEFVDFDPIFSWPKPLQSPHPPIVLGAHGGRGLERVVRYCDGWIPIGSFSDVAADIGRLREAERAAGREAGSVEVSVFGAAPDADVLRGYRDGGVARAVFGLPQAGAGRILPILDRLASLAVAVG